MGNLKHTVVALAAVVMIGSLAVNQADDLKGSYNIAALLTSAEAESIVNEEVEKIDVASEAEAQAELEAQYTEDELNEIIEAKSHAGTGYVILTTGVLSVKGTPSEEAPEIDALEKNVEIEILESTEEWYKIRYAEGKTGYVSRSKITEDKEEAELAAKYYDNYRYGTIVTNGGTIRVRKGPSTSSSILGELENGSTVILYWNEGDFAKVCYGTNYEDGYIIASAIELQDTWMPKTELTSKKQEVAARLAREKAEREEKERRAAALAAASQRATTSSKEAKGVTYTDSGKSTSTGLAIVNTAKKYLGVKYVYGGTTPSGFDCSGLVKYVFNKNGISVSRTSASQALQGKKVSTSDLQPGDLLFFAKNGRVHHVGIYAGGGQMIHAPHTGDVVRYAPISSRSIYCARRLY